MTLLIFLLYSLSLISALSFILVTLFALICIPIWSATTEAYVKGDFDWIRKSKVKLLKIARMFILVGFLMVVCSPVIFKIWLGKNFYGIDIKSTGLMYIYCSFLLLYNVYGYIINGIGKLTIQLIFTTILAIAYVPIAYYCGRAFGLNAILLLMCFNAIANLLWSRIQLTKLLNRTALGIWNQ